MTDLRRASSYFAALGAGVVAGAIALGGCGGGSEESASSFGPGSDSNADTASVGESTAAPSGTDGSASDSSPSSSGETGGAVDTDSASAGEAASETADTEGADTEAPGTETDSAATDDGSGSAGDDSTGDEPLSDDPFEPGACEGAPLTAAAADALLGGAARTVLSDGVIQVRSRTCPAGACGAWGANDGWMIHYLTYSGGVKTRWTDLLAQMDLVLFDDNGTTRISMQHETFGAGGYPDDDGVVYDLPPVAQNYPHLRAYNQFPENPSDYIDLDYQVSEGTLVLGEDCAVWTANPFGMGTPHLQQFGVLFRW